MAIKIQINSLEALERLIGGDNELEIEVRNSVVENFTKKHLKAIAEDTRLRLIGEAVTNEIKNTFFEESKGYNSKITFKKEVLERLSDDINLSGRKQLRETVELAIGESQARERINEAIESAALRIADELTDGNLERRIDNLVNKKLKEKLGIG